MNGSSGSYYWVYGSGHGKVTITIRTLEKWTIIARRRYTYVMSAARLMPNLQYVRVRMRIVQPRLRDCDHMRLPSIWLECPLSARQLVRAMCTA